MGHAQAVHGPDRGEGVVQHVAPVAEHVEDDAAAVRLAVVPARALGGAPVALEDPVAELPADREDPAEEAFVAQLPELHEPGQEQLVVHYAVLHAHVPGVTGQLEGFFQGFCGRFLAVHVLARVHRLRQQFRTQLRGGRVEEYLVGRVGQRGADIIRPAVHAVFQGERFHLLRVPADQDRVDLDAVTAGEPHAALFPDGQDRADQVLVHAHAPGDAVHDDSES